MYLSKLQIQGFKSFASGTSLDFGRGITAIVGPNGSGKSNVADAIRWVLGEQSLKLLRGKKSDDVIFAGSDKKSRLGVAEVSLYLDNSDRRAPIDYGELILTRRVYRDGEGEYMINNQPSRLQDIHLMLAQANFGQRTYSVIGQGMIDSFLLSSPQERKHLFDEAAGVRQYQMKREQAVSKLAQSKENLAQGEAIMQEIEPRLRSLTRQVKRLERREEIEQELKQEYTRFFGLRWQELQRELKTVTEEHGQADQRRAEIQKEIEAIQQELEKIEKERSASEQFSGLQKAYNHILDQKNKLLEQRSAAKGKLDVAARQAGQAETVFRQQQMQDVKRSLAQIQEELEALEPLLKSSREKLKQAEHESATLEKKFASVQQRLTSFRQQLQKSLSWSKAKSEVDGLTQVLDQVTTELSAEAPALPKVRTAIEKVHQQLTSLSQRFGAANDAVDPLTLLTEQQELLELATQRQALGLRLATAQTEVQRHLDQQQRLSDQQQKLKSDFEHWQAESSVEELAKTHPEQAYAMYVDQVKKLDGQIEDADQRLKVARDDIQQFNQNETTKKDRLFSLQKEFRGTQHRLNISTNQVNELQVSLARLEQRQEDLQREIEQAMGPAGVETVTAAAKKKLDGDVAMLAEEIGHLKHQLELIGGIDEQVTAEYTDTNQRWEFLSKQAEDLKAGITQLEAAIAELDEIIKKQFDAAFKKINAEFNTYFRALFRGGRAELVLIKEAIREDDDMTEAEVAAAQDTGPAAEPKPEPQAEKVVTGIDIKATPPGKKLQSIAMLSGGERALSSIALLCAIIANNPSPFVVLDEVDAALDEANSQRFAAILDQLAHKTQFITITHNRATMEKAQILYGVTMGDDGVSQLLSVKMDQVEEMIKKHGNR